MKQVKIVFDDGVGQLHSVSFGLDKSLEETKQVVEVVISRLEVIQGMTNYIYEIHDTQQARKIGGNENE